LLGFFGSHIIFTLCLDGQALMPDLYPQILRDLARYEVETFHDTLMGTAANLPWFRSMVCLEFIFQLPFFLAAIYYIGYAKATNYYPDGFRSACIGYGAHTCTTLVPILNFFWSQDYDGTTQQSIALTALYLPYLLIPAWLLWTAATDNSNERLKSN